MKLAAPIQHGCPSAGLACPLGASTAAGSSVRPNQRLKARPHALNRFALAHKRFIAHFDRTPPSLRRRPLVLLVTLSPATTDRPAPQGAPARTQSVRPFACAEA